MQHFIVTFELSFMVMPETSYYKGNTNQLSLILNRISTSFLNRQNINTKEAK